MFYDATAFHQNLTNWPLIAQESLNFCTRAICDDARPTSTSTPQWIDALFIGVVFSSVILLILKQTTSSNRQKIANNGDYDLGLYQEMVCLPQNTPSSNKVPNKKDDKASPYYCPINVPHNKMIVNIPIIGRTDDINEENERV